MKLYEIASTYRQALDFFADHEMDISAESVKDTLETIEGNFEQKAVNVAAFARQMEAEAEAIKHAEEGMAKRRKALENRAKWLRDYVKQEMEIMGMKKISFSPWFVLSVQKNPDSLDIYDEDVLPTQYVETKQVIETVIDKAAIKATLAAGDNVPGARLTNGTRLVIH